MDEEITSLEQLLDRLGKAADGRTDVSLGAILEALGRRSFGPVLLLAGLITIAPLVGDIPGVPTVMGVLVLLTAGQLLVRRRHFWVPRPLLRRSVSQVKLCKALKGMRRPARFVDRLLRPRLTMFVKGPAVYIIAVACIVIALAMPAMEFVPFSATGGGAALIAFGLSLIGRDGLMALIALGVTATTFGLVLYSLV